MKSVASAEAGTATNEINFRRPSQSFNRTLYSLKCMTALDDFFNLFRVNRQAELHKLSQARRLPVGVLYLHT